MAKSVDPRGLLDTRPEEAVNPETAALAATLLAGSLSSSLTDLNLKKAGLHCVPATIGALTALRKLDLSLNPISALPDQLEQLSSLRIFFCLGTRFTSIPSVVGRLPSLYMLSFKSNQLETIAEDALPPTIEWLILTDNKLTTLPRSIGRCPVRKLMLTNNRLKRLPDELAQCRSLEMIRLADNQLEALPAGFLALPKLAWMGIAGNPMVAGDPPSEGGAAPQTRWVPPEELQVLEQIGSGGGGFVHRALWTAAVAVGSAAGDSAAGDSAAGPGAAGAGAAGAGDVADAAETVTGVTDFLLPRAAAAPDGARAVEVAVKLFRAPGTVTDGDPAHEIAVGPALTHPNTIRVLGATPLPQLGLVLELLDLAGGAWRELGRPPDFETCTRDTYDEGASFAPRAALRTLTGVAAACAHLHAAGFTHGDLYAHNTMVKAPCGEPKVGDFGAAYRYGGGEAFDDADAALIERVEVRAFGCLAEELVARRAAPASAPTLASREAIEGEDALAASLAAIAARCMAADVAGRPCFAVLHAELRHEASKLSP